MPKQPKISEAKHPYVYYRVGSDEVALQGKVTYGNGYRYVLTLLDPREVVKMAHYLAPVLNSKDKGDRGHAMWHYDNPDREYPCETCPGYVQDAAPRLKRVDPKPLASGPHYWGGR